MAPSAHFVLLDEDGRPADPDWRGVPANGADIDDWRRWNKPIGLVPGSVGLVVVTVSRKTGTLAGNAVHDALQAAPVMTTISGEYALELWLRRGPEPEPTDGTYRHGRVIDLAGYGCVKNLDRLANALDTMRASDPIEPAQLPGYRRDGG